MDEGSVEGMNDDPSESVLQSQPLHPKSVHLPQVIF